MLVMDLDGTLISRDQILSPANRSALESLGERGIPRVVATGRSLFAAQRVIDAEFPIDYLVFSSGVGTVRWPEGELIDGFGFEPAEQRKAAEQLSAAGRDFMLQAEVPDTHRFHYHRGGSGTNPDFDRRVERYADHAENLVWDELGSVSGSHFVAIEPPGTPSIYAELKRLLHPLHVVRTTSPLDHESRWIEVYPSGVGKSFAANKLRTDLGLPLERVFAVGNDFNDEDLLTWASHAFVVANAHLELRERYETVASNEDDGVSEVIGRLLGFLEQA